MKILIVQDTDWIRRNPIQHTHLAERMALRGHEIRIIDYEILWRTEGKKELFSKRQVFHVSRLFKEVSLPVIRPGILKIPVLDYFSMLFTYTKEINRQIVDFQPDVIISNDILTTYLSYRAAKKNNVPTIYYAIDIEHRLVPFKFLQPLGKKIEARNIRTADLVISINEMLREYTIQMGANRSKTMVIRAGIDSEHYDPNKIDGSEIRKRYGLNEDDIVLFFMGWLYDFSGLKEVAVDLAEIKDKKPNIKMLIVGDGDAYEDLQKIREQNNLNNHIILAGKQLYDNLPEYIAAADICLLPAYNNEIMRDIVPIKMYEYMAMRKPVISTKLPGVMKEFGEGNGVIYVERTEDVLTKALELIGNGDIDILGSKSRSFVERNSWDKITDRFEAVLLDDINENGN
jgi:glycosyltransferase involved in cell wall biosynthesis